MAHLHSAISMKKTINLTLNFEFDMDTNQATLQDAQVKADDSLSVRERMLKVLHSMLGNAETQFRALEKIETKMPGDLHLELQKTEAKAKYWALKDALTILQEL